MWIALEGGEGTGKSTQAALLAASLDAVLTREPGGTALGVAVRALVLDPSASMDARTEALLMAADRAAHVASVVAPALALGRHVVSDRSAWSSLAYQGGGRGLDIDELWQLSDWAMGGRWPDLAILLDVPAGVSSSRLSARGGTDRMESMDSLFHDRVRSAFTSFLVRWPDQWVVVDGTGSSREVAARVLGIVQPRL
jgi:dTMP kinase